MLYMYIRTRTRQTTSRPALLNSLLFSSESGVTRNLFLFLHLPLILPRQLCPVRKRVPIAKAVVPVRQVEGPVKDKEAMCGA